MKHRCTLSVRGYEIDGYGHVNNAVYLNYLEVARGEYLKAAGFDYEAFMKAGYGIWVVRIEIDYRLSARPGQELSIDSELVERGQTYGVMSQTVSSPEGVCAQAKVKWAVVNQATGRPCRMPAEFDKPALRL